MTRETHYLQQDSVHLVGILKQVPLVTLVNELTSREILLRFLFSVIWNQIIPDSGKVGKLVIFVKDVKKVNSSVRNRVLRLEIRLPFLRIGYKI